MIHFGVAGLVLRDSVLGVSLSFKPCWHRSHLLGVAGNTHVLSGHVECVTGRQLRITKNGRRLLGEDDLSEKQRKSERSQNVHRRCLLGLAEGLGKQLLMVMIAHGLLKNALKFQDPLPC